MKSISVGELRQNPASMIADLEAGEPYALTRHNHRIGTIVPYSSSASIVRRKRTGAARTLSLPRHELTTAASVDELIDSDKGDW